MKSKKGESVGIFDFLLSNLVDVFRMSKERKKKKERRSQNVLEEYKIP